MRMFLTAIFTTIITLRDLDVSHRLLGVEIKVATVGWTYTSDGGDKTYWDTKTWKYVKVLFFRLCDNTSLILILR
jgi:hypothetical protein